MRQLPLAGGRSSAGHAGAAHLAGIEQPEALNDRVLDWVRGISYREGSRRLLAVPPGLEAWGEHACEPPANPLGHENRMRLALLWLW